MTEQKRRLGVFLLPVAALLGACLLFSLLARYDNKYTYGGAQPVGGLLTLEEAEFAAHPVRFLVHEWEFYPGRLLSPDDFVAGPPDAYRQLVAIGRYSGLGGGAPGLGRHGQGTYRLTLDLPEPPRDYSIALPEVFSAYHFYVDGQLRLTLGQPEGETYQPGIQNRIVTFTAAGRTELLLAAADYSAYYSGLVYPPAFGEPQAVRTMQNLRLLLAETVLLIALLGAVLSLYLGIRLRMRQGLLFALLCLCYIGQNSYSLLHTYFLTGVQPWYTVEIVCVFGLMATAVAALGTLCGHQGRMAWLVPWALALASVLAGVYAAGSSVLGDMAAGAFSLFSALCKWGTALYLLVMSARYWYRRDARFSALLASSVFFAVSLLADRVYPLYEPVYGGWFGEIGAAALVLGLACALWSDLADAYRFRLSFAEEKRQMRHLLDLQQKHYRSLSQQIEQTRIARHDLRQHIHALRGLSEGGEFARVRDYLYALEPGEAEYPRLSYAKNPVVDAILQHYGSLARREDVSFDVAVELPETIGLPDEELGIILGNLLENAVDAAVKQETGGRFVRVRGRVENSRLLLVIENGFVGKLRRRNGRLLSSKRDDVGIGVESVRAVIARRRGLSEFEAEDGVFRASLLLPLALDPSEGREDGRVDV